MPRRSKGPRLYYREARNERSAAGVWVIRDGSREISTGCGEAGLCGAEKALADYIAAKHEPAVTTGDPGDVLVADVLALYAREKAPKQADPVSVAGWIDHLLDFFGDMTCADIKRSTCTAYLAHRIKQPRRAAKTAEARAVMVKPETARRELETLSAAIGWWDRETPFTRRPVVTLPAKAESLRDALTRSEAAALLKAAMGYRLKDGRWERLSGSARANRLHLRRFILLGLYTGTRQGVMPKLLWSESPTSAWVDLERGVIYRRGKAERDHRTKRRPMVRLPPRLLAHLRRWQRQDVAKAAQIGAPLNAVLHHGGEALAGRIRRGFAACVRDACLDPAVTPHWMRHTAATWLCEMDVSPWDAAAYLGMTVQTLERCYGHHRPGHQEKARKALGSNHAGTS